MKLTEQITRKIPTGKTAVEVIKNYRESEFRIGDFAYIDGYVRGGDDIPNLVCVRLSDGVIDFARSYDVRAISARNLSRLEEEIY